MLIISSIAILASIMIIIIIFIPSSSSPKPKASCVACSCKVFCKSLSTPVHTSQTLHAQFECCKCYWAPVVLFARFTKHRWCSLLGLPSTCGAFPTGLPMYLLMTSNSHRDGQRETDQLNFCWFQNCFFFLLYLFMTSVWHKGGYRETDPLNFLFLNMFHFFDRNKLTQPGTGRNWSTKLVLFEKCLVTSILFSIMCGGKKFSRCDHFQCFLIAMWMRNHKSCFCPVLLAQPEKSAFFQQIHIFSWFAPPAGGS